MHLCNLLKVTNLIQLLFCLLVRDFVWLPLDLPQFDLCKSIAYSSPSREARRQSLSNEVASMSDLSRKRCGKDFYKV